MGWPIALMAAGTAMNVMGNMRANQDKARAEAANASYYREQAAFADEAGKRAEKIFERKADRLYGQQVSAFAKAGVDIGSGSALDFLGESKALQIEERYAIKREAEMNVRLASLRANASMETSRAYGDSTNNFLQAGGTILTGAGMMAK